MPRTRDSRLSGPVAGRGTPKADRSKSSDDRAERVFSRRWWLLPLLTAAAIGIFVWTYYPVARVQYRETRAKALLQAEYQALEARNARLQTQVDRLKTPEGVEDYARTQLGMVKAGEHVVVVMDGSESTRTMQAKAEASAAAPPRLADSSLAAKPPIGPWTAFFDSVFGVQ
jgi:cell division protein FtsB